MFLALKFMYIDDMDHLEWNSEGKKRINFGKEKQNSVTHFQGEISSPSKKRLIHKSRLFWAKSIKYILDTKQYSCENSGCNLYTDFSVFLYS